MALFKRKNTDHPIALYNTLTRKKEVFEALKPPQVKMYTCGPTVYDFAHIGNLRSYVFSDILKRTLIRAGFEVSHTINITDFGHLSGDGDDGDDKMMIALKREGKKPSMAAVAEIADYFTEAFQKDVLALGIMPPTHYTRASAFIQEEIALIKTLDDKGYTYETSDGIYFDISRFPSYGKLGNINLDALKDGARVDVNPEKRHPADFAVWKKGELGWDSVWGKGFPGWHIECTAMAFATLGKQIDIHTGGIDHIATHHNGEIAQAEAATGKTYVRYWMHNAFITIDNTKIAKSLGNGIKLKNITDLGYSPLAYRYWLLTGHYRSHMNFTFDALDGAKQAHYKLRRHVYEELRGVTPSAPAPTYVEKLTHALHNDLDTPGAIATLWEVVKDKSLTPEVRLATIRHFDDVLVLGLNVEKNDIGTSLGVLTIESLPADLQDLITEREKARAEKRWSDADALRHAINLKGYLVEDMPDGAKITKST